MIFNAPDGYESLCSVLDEAVEQASKGKGKERHASEGEAYKSQIICEVTRRLGPGYPLGQAVKKIYESQRIGGEKGVAELLGAINYIAAAIIVDREMDEHDRALFAKEMAKNAERRAEAEGCEELVQKDETFDAPQTKEELYERIASCNPAVFKGFSE